MSNLGEGDKLDIRRLERHEWHGYLTAANAEAVAKRLRATLKGVLYTYVNTWRGPDNPPDVYASEMMSDVTVTVYQSGVMISVSDTKGLWFIESRLIDREAANKIYYEHGELGKAGAWLKFDGEVFTMRRWNDASERFDYVIVRPEHPEYMKAYLGEE